MSAKFRIVKEGTQAQGVDEEIVYSITTTPWGGTPTSPAVAVKDEDGSDVTSTVMPSGSPTVNGDVITLPAMKSLSAGMLYRVEVKFTSGGNVLEAIIPVKGEE